MAPRHALATAEQAGVRLGRTWVFTALDFTGHAGDRLHLSGPNGAGKTTVLRCLAGALTLRHGRMNVAGHPAGSAAARATVGVCLDPENALHSRLTATENLLLGARLRLSSPAARSAADQLVDTMGISSFADREVRHCSAGQRARISIARALVGDPQVLLFDEPTRSLDADGRTRFWAALDQRPAAAVLLVSHDPEDADRCSSRVFLPSRRNESVRGDVPGRPVIR